MGVVQLVPPGSGPADLAASRFLLVQRPPEGLLAGESGGRAGLSAGTMAWAAAAACCAAGGPALHGCSRLCASCCSTVETRKHQACARLLCALADSPPSPLPPQSLLAGLWEFPLQPVAAEAKKSELKEAVGGYVSSLLGVDLGEGGGASAGEAGGCGGSPGDQGAGG